VDWSPEAARSAVAALDLIAVPAAALSPAKLLIAFNTRFKNLAPTVIRPPHDHVEIVDPAAQRLFDSALARLARERGEGAQPICIRPERSRSPMVMHLLPVPVAACDDLPGVLALLTVTLVVRRNAPSATLIQTLFDMTPAEARVARSVAQGETIRGIAAGLNLSPETVRKQLKAALAKTGCARNIDLAVLLAGPGSSIPAITE
jgi:DNA-binding CsgD family transcriptional regulator